MFFAYIYDMYTYHMNLTIQKHWVPTLIPNPLANVAVLRCTVK